MSEDTSLTNAVKQAAGISLTMAVKDVAGCRDRFVYEVLDAQDGATQEAIARPAPRPLVARRF
jgi:hypothetical protein